MDLTDFGLKLAIDDNHRWNPPTPDYLGHFHADVFDDGYPIERVVTGILDAYGTYDAYCGDTSFGLVGLRAMLDEALLELEAIETESDRYARGAIERRAAYDVGLAPWELRLAVLAGLIWSLLDRSDRDNQEFHPQSLVAAMHLVQRLGVGSFLREVQQLLVR
jgi:hypothetical protein